MASKKIALIVLCLAFLGVGAFSFFHFRGDSASSGASLATSLLPGPEEPNASLENVDIKASAGNPDELRSWLRKVGPKRVMERLLENAGGGSIEGCHTEAHVTGRLAYELYGSAAFGDGISHCHSGYYHGAMEAMLREKGTSRLAETIREICALFPTNFEAFECLHGVGHGVMAFEDYDLPGALKDCESLESDDKRNACYGGAFMENVVAAQGMSAGGGGHTTSWISRDPHYPCNALPETAAIQEQCYLMQTTWMLALFDHNFGKVIPECLKASATVIPLCFASMGRDVAGESLRDPGEIARICAHVPRENEYSNYCIAGGLNAIIDFWGGGLKGQASELCKIIPEGAKSRCYTLLADRLPGIFTSRADIEAVCATFEPKYQALCSKP